MKQEQTKALLVNIATGVIVLSLLVIGYLVFSGDKSPSGIDTTAITASTEAVGETVAIGNEVEATIRSLSALKGAVENATAVFEMPSFKNLQNFSAGVPEEGVGRENPFTVTDWKSEIQTVFGTGSGSAEVGAPATTPVTSPRTVVSPPSSVTFDPPQGI